MKMMQRVWAALHEEQRKRPHFMLGIEDSHLGVLSRYETASEEERARMFLTIADQAYRSGHSAGTTECQQEYEKREEEMRQIRLHSEDY